MNKSKMIYYAPWTLTIVVAILAVYVWGHSFAWQLSAINAYQFFPVLGLLAFSILWAQYIVGFAQETFLKGNNFALYFRTAGYTVLAAIVLHPSILIYKRFRDGFGLPPHSYETYVAPSVAWVTLLGTASLLAFLAFELHRWYSKKSWWKYVASLSDVAMLAIFYHGLRLGSQLQGGWFVAVWWFYGITLVAVLVRKYALLLGRKTKLQITD